MKLADQIMIAMFGSALHQFGFGVIQTVTHHSQATIEATIKQCPGVGYLLKHAHSPIWKNQKSAQPLIKVQTSSPLFIPRMESYQTFDRYLSEQKRFSKDGFTVCNSIKLAFLFQPNESSLHRILADSFDASKGMANASTRFESLVLAGEALGTRSNLFSQLFKL